MGVLAFSRVTPQTSFMYKYGLRSLYILDLVSVASLSRTYALEDYDEHNPILYCRRLSLPNGLPDLLQP